MTKNEIARKFDISLTTLSTWITEGLPYTRKGGKGKGYDFDLQEVEVWIAKYKLPASTDDMTYADARRRHEAAKAAIKELELKVRKGELLDVDIVMKLQGGVLQSIRSRILSLPAKLATLSFGSSTIAENESIIRKGIYEVLDEVRDINFSEVSRVGDIPKSVTNDGRSKKSKGQRVGRQRKKATA